MQIPKEIIADIKHEMIMQDINSKELALSIGMSEQNLSKILKTANPQLSSLLSICNGLGLKILLTKDESK